MAKYILAIMTLVLFSGCLDVKPGHYEEPSEQQQAVGCCGGGD